MNDAKIDLTGMSIINEPKLDIFALQLKSIAESLKILVDLELGKKQMAEEQRVEEKRKESIRAEGMRYLPEFVERLERATEELGKSSKMTDSYFWQEKRVKELRAELANHKAKYFLS